MTALCGCEFPYVDVAFSRSPFFTGQPCLEVITLMLRGAGSCSTGERL